MTTSSPIIRAGARLQGALSNRCLGCLRDLRVAVGQSQKQEKVLLAWQPPQVGTTEYRAVPSPCTAWAMRGQSSLSWPMQHFGKNAPWQKTQTHTAKLQEETHRASATPPPKASSLLEPIRHGQDRGILPRTPHSRIPFSMLAASLTRQAVEAGAGKGWRRSRYW